MRLWAQLEAGNHRKFCFWFESIILPLCFEFLPVYRSLLEVIYSVVLKACVTSLTACCLLKHMCLFLLILSTFLASY